MVFLLRFDRWKGAILMAPLVAVVVTLGACGKGEEMHIEVAANEADFSVLSGARILFAHQSVGRNLLEGLSVLTGRARSGVRVTSINNGIDGKPGLFHVDIGQNGDPIGKIRQFLQLTQSTTNEYDVAILKLCYVDIGHDGTKNPLALVDEYAKSVVAIRAARPKLRLLHTTVPLRADPPGWKTQVKRMLGLPTDEDDGNQLRNAYNAEIRKRFAGEAILDIAEVESTLPSGARSYFSYKNKVIYTLAGVYTTDGGHLNELGRKRLALAFVSAVAAALR